MRFRLAPAFVLICLSLMSSALYANSAPEGPVILSVAGLDGPPHELSFDRALLENLPSTRIETTTIWTEGVQSFVGVELAALLDHLGISSGTVRVVAANDYAIEIPVAEIQPGGALLAYLQNDQPMSRRDRGPIWLVYPYDSDVDLQTELIYSRSVWQLVRIEILP